MQKKWLRLSPMKRYFYENSFNNTDIECIRYGTSYEETPTSTANDSPCFYTVLLHSSSALPSKRSNETNMTSNKADAIPDELRYCAMETIEQSYPANE
ncbi:hypothetical protein TNCV_3430681 [Trichonephila clavipes]|nr:hypothetical protein TNCV_3430681 [Trichonephila clavipes]